MRCCCCVSSKSRKRSPVEVSVHFPSSCISMDEAGNFGACLRLVYIKLTSMNRMLVTSVLFLSNRRLIHHLSTL
jgi:hypothetical protein